ncbi:MAG: ATP-binding protein, partial [Kiritimatiellae bacterium]|nr:ATP-binding protein [Kiritimatiellia bacterium]
RLRKYLEEMVEGRLSERVVLLQDMDDASAIERALNLILEQMRSRITRMEDELKKIEWLLNRTVIPAITIRERKKVAASRSALVTRCVSESYIKRLVSEDVLLDLVGDFLDLVETSAVVFERDGKIVLSMTVSDWCRLLSGSATPQTGGVGLNHEIKPTCRGSCWQEAGLRCAESGGVVDIECAGGIRFYCAPIRAADRVVGVMGFGYGDPPLENDKLTALSQKHGISLEKLRETAAMYETRPAFIVSLAKNHLLTATRLLGEMIERREAEEVLRKSEEELRRHKENLEEIVSKRTAELKETNERLRCEVEQRRKAERIKDDFVSTVSHEIRTPLAITKEGVSLLADGIAGPLTEKQAKIVAAAQGNIERLERIINDLLDISKIEAGKLDVRKERVDLCPLIRRTVTAFEPMVTRKNLSLTLDLPAVPVEIYGDADRITQILTNLISNAVKFTEQGGITVRARVVDGFAECSVSDTGIGISEENLPRVFEKFVQFARTAGAGRKGTGLGLAIVKSLVELHNGRVSVESKPGAGTTFTFIIPVYSERAVIASRIADVLAAARRVQRLQPLVVLKISAKDPQYDKALKEMVGPHFSRLIDSGVVGRAGDVVLADSDGRLVVLPELAPEALANACSRWKRGIRDFLAEQKFQGEVSIHAGAACYPADGATPEELLTNAERKLE